MFERSWKRWSQGGRWAGLLALVLALSARSGGAADLPPFFQLVDYTPGVTLVAPVGVAFAPDGRMFVAEKRGRVQVLHFNPAAADPVAPYDSRTEFLDIQSEVLDHYDRGLLGIALDPDFANDPWVYLAYAVDPDGTDSSQYTFVRVTRYRESDTTASTADVSTRQILLGDTWAEGIPDAYFSHMGAMLVFGEDGTLLMTTGDGAHFDGDVDAGGRDPDQFLPGRSDPAEDIGAFRSQSLNSLAGKVLRLDKDTGLGVPSNPFYEAGDPGSRASRIWSLGLRNPYRGHLLAGSGSSDPADANPGTLILPDVQWWTWEEVSLATAPGENFGWPCYEANREHSGYQNVPQPAGAECPPDDSGITQPVIVWPHQANTWRTSTPTPGLHGRAAVGAAYYSATGYPIHFRNKLYFADYPRSWIAAARVDESMQVESMEEFATSLQLPVDLTLEPANGDLLYISHQNGRIYRIHYAGPSGVGAPPVTPPNPVAVAGTGEVTVSWDPNPEADMAGYRVYRRTLPQGTDQLLTPELLVDTSYRDETALNGQRYEYSVEAVDSEAGGMVSPRSPPLEVIPSSKAWEFWTFLPGPRQLVDELPAPFPRTFEVPPNPPLAYEHSFWTNRAPRLWRTLPGNIDFTLETREELTVYQTGWEFHSGLMVRFPPNDHFNWGFGDGTDLVLERSSVGTLATVSNTSPVVSLRVVRTGNQYSFEYRVDDAAAWVVAATASEAAAVDYVGSIVAVSVKEHQLTKRIHRLALNELPPSAAAQPSVTIGSVPLAVEFTNNSYDLDGDLLTHEWDFGDGNISSDPDPLHVYDKPGIYSVVLTVQDGSGLRQSCDPMQIQVTGNNPPVATILEPLDGAEYADPTLSLDLVGSATDEEDVPDSLTYDWTVHLHQGGLTTLDYIDPPSLAVTSMIPNTTDDGSGVYLEVILTVTDRAGDSHADTVLVHDRSLPPGALIDLMASQPDTTGPPAVPGAASPWNDLAQDHDATLLGFDVPGPGTGWAGAGLVGDPYRLALDGVDDCAVIAAGSVPQLQGATEASVELWARWSEETGSRAYLLEWLETYAAPFAGFSLALEAGQLQVFLDPWEAAASLVPDRWFHVVATQGPGGTTVFVDGQEVLTSPASHLGSQLSEIVLGAGTYAGAGTHRDFFRGDLAEVRLYDFALSPANVAVRFAEGQAGFENPPPVYSVSPDSTANDADLSVTITGEGFDPGATVRLRLAGEADVVAQSVIVSSDSTIQCLLPTTGQAVGLWDVVVVQPNSLEGILPQAVNVTEPSALRLSLEAALADGVAPPVVPGAASPWVDSVDSALADLQGFVSPGPASGWQGTGGVGDPYRLRLDGIDDRVRFAQASVPVLQAPTELTVELWFATGDDVDTRQVVLDWMESMTGDEPGCQIYLEAATLRLRLGVLTSFAVVNPNEFVHVALVYGAGGLAIYTNGILVQQVVDSNLGSQISELVLGDSVNGGEFFRGDLAAFRIHDRALAGPTIQAIYQSEWPTYAPPPPVTTLAALPDRSQLGDEAQFGVDLEYNDNGTGDRIRGASVQVDFDPAALAVASVTEGALLPSSGDATFFAWRNDGPGRIVVDASILGSTAGVTGQGILGQVDFSVIPGAVEGVSDIDITVLSAVDPTNPPLNVAIETADAQVTVDVTAPQAIADLAMAPQDSTLQLTWTPPPSDYVGVTLFYRPWSLDPDLGYPEFDDAGPAPAWPVDLAEARDPALGWTELELDGAPSAHDLDLGGRTAAFVIACSRDAAGNLSDFSLAPRERSLTYLLGDLGELDQSGTLVETYDGRVDGVLDLPVFSWSYGSASTDTSFLAAADIGPTDLGGSMGIPLTDDMVDFDDLVVFSLNFGTEIGKNATPIVAKLTELPSPGPLAVELGDPQTTGSIVEIPVRLRGNGDGVKAVHLELRHDPEQLRFVDVRRADVLRLAQVPVFLTTLPRESGLAVDLAVLGAEGVLQGDGDVALLRFEVLEGLGGFLQVDEADLRDVAGLALDVDTEAASVASLIAPPRAFRLLAATPNPFNPRTTLRFELPSASRVRLAVFDVSGRLVRELVNEALPAGYHSVVWQGRDGRGRSVASGVYLYELSAPGFRDVNKMLLVK